MTQRKEFGIRYVKLHFTLRIAKNTVLPKYKASALRGGMGEMLLRANCIRDRKCEQCDFESECLVRRMMYSKMEIQPEFMSSGDSVGYVIECEDYRDEFDEGDELQFNLLLFGKTIVYFSHYLNAVYALGKNGLGREHGRFEIVSVSNTKKKDLLRANDVNMSEYKISTVKEYIDYRRANIQTESSEGRIKFKTPLTLKFRGELVDRFDIEPVFEAAKRRIYMLDCFEGIESDVMTKKPELPEVVDEEHHRASVRRYSNHQERAMTLHGIQGSMTLKEIPDEILDILLAGELMHIGKNTSFGFGRYRVV